MLVKYYIAMTVFLLFFCGSGLSHNYRYIYSPDYNPYESYHGESGSGENSYTETNINIHVADNRNNNNNFSTGGETQKK